MIIMLKFEVKKIFSKRINKLIFMLLFMIVLIGSFLTVRDVRCYQEDGTVLSGFAAAAKLKNMKNTWKGEITEEIIQQVVKANSSNKNSADSEAVMLARQQSFEDIREIINCGFSPKDGYDYFTVDHISPEKAAGLYEQRITKLKEELSASGGQEGNYSQREQEFLIEQYENLDTPLYYEYAEGWKALLDSQYLPTLMIITIVMIGFLVSGVFSDEFQYKADSIFFSARLGRGRGTAAKIGAGLLAVTVVYWSVMLLYSALILCTLGFGGAGCMIQTGMGNWESIYNITYVQDWLLSMFGGYVGNLFILSFTMLISAKSRSTALAITIPFVLSCAPMFLGRVSILTNIMNFFPDMLLRICKFLDVLLVCEAGGTVVGIYPFLIVLYLFLSFAMIPVLYCVYKRAEVK